MAPAPRAASAAPGDVGHEGPSFAGASGAVTGEKPESKLWWNDGAWWASLWDAAGSGYRIHRLNVSTQTWVNTGTALDPRSTSRADTLWHQASGKLYVASHVYSESGGTADARLYRYSYNAQTDAYTLDAGFPVVINSARSESLVIDRDSSGQLWATWVQSGQVRVNRTVCNPTCNDAAWGTAFVPAVNGTFPNSTSVSSDDISSIIAFGNSRIGLMWSNQSHDAWYFAIHTDTAADTTWGASRRVFQGPDEADDHVNLATLLAADDGRIFVAVKTSLNSSNEPAIKVLERIPGSGSWLSHTVSTGQYDQTRPIVLIDESASVLHVFSSDEGGGGIYHKSAPLSNVSFTDGKGTLVMWDDDVREINDPTSTKQNLNSTTGLVVLGSNNVTDRYWHHYDPLGSTPPPPAPVANFSATPTTGTAPLAVSFTDVSTNAPTSWAWDFDNNGTVDSTAQHPQRTYPTAGTYSVTLTATNGTGSGSLTKTAFITVGSTGGGGTTQTFVPIADAKVSTDWDTNYGSATGLRVRTSTSNNWNSYLKFNLSGLGSSVSSAVLRLYVTSGTKSGGGVYAVNSGWIESTINRTNAPAITGTPLDTLGTVATGTWVEWDVTSAVTGNGVISFGLHNTGGSGEFSSREGANPPQLIVTSGGAPPPPPAPVANFSATPTTGTAPLAVSFTDVSTNAPTSWAWDFDNNGTVDSTAQHPQRTYPTAGTYSVTLTATNGTGSGSLTKTAFITVGSTPPPPPPAPVANFSATPTTGTAPLAVSFTDVSTNAPTSWAWDFDNNGTVDSTAQHPQRTYPTAGTYSVTLTATNGTGSGSLTKTAFITVGSTGGGGTTQTFVPIADAKVSTDWDTNYGSATGLRVRTSTSNNWNSYLKFNLSGLGSSVSSAVLRLYVTSGTKSGGGVYAVNSGWIESTINRTNAPAITGTPLDTLGTVATGTWVEWDVTSAVTGNGVISFGLHNTGGSGEFSSREGANPPQLIVTSGG